jgi:replication factor A1
VHFEFVKIGSLVNVEPNGTVDVIAIVKGASDCQEITSQKLGGKLLKKRDLTLIDDSETEVGE